MIRLIIIFIIAVYSFSGSLTYDEIADMVEKIKKKREGIGIRDLANTPNPFTIVKRVKKHKKIVEKKKKPTIIKIVEPTHILTAILNGRAFINGKWYSLNDKIGDYEVVYIGETSVVLRGSRATKRLKIKSKATKINLFEGDKI